MLHNFIIQDIKAANIPHKDNKLNKTLQNFMYTMLADPCDIAAKKSLAVMKELYRRQIWNDAKTVNVIAEACFSSVHKILVEALHFFLHADADLQAYESDDDDVAPDVDALQHAVHVGGKKGARLRKVKKAIDTVRRKDKRAQKADTCHFSALHLLNDPQTFVERLLSFLRKTNERFDTRLLLMNVISRVVGVHKLMLLSFYPFLLKYLQPHQKNVTQILSFVAQASHDLVPPEVLEPLVMALANHFVSETCAPEVMNVG